LNSPTPALVTQRAAQRLPRVALLLFCAAYVLPGVFGRDPWKNADVTAFGHMASIAGGHSGWLSPSIAGLPGDVALVPYWLGAAFIRLLGGVLDPAVAARVPFALLLVLVLVLTWYATYHLARTEAAQPLPFAFGGEATPVDYARAIADGALLAVMATLGLLQLGHETTPELVQLAGATLFLYALAAGPFRKTRSRVAALIALPVMAASGAPAIASVLAIAATAICWRSTYAQVRGMGIWVAAAGVLAAACATALHAWGWRVAGVESLQALGLLRQLVWFTWPAWPLALWTLWRWRGHLLHRHISVPLGCALPALLASLAMGGSDRALMLALPALAVLAAFALPTLQRSAAAAIDWFSVFFFSICALAIWVIYAAMQTGFPAKPAANVARLAPEFSPSFSLLALVIAVLGTLAWLWLVRWRTGRHRHPLWKSLVLPAGGVAVCWLLLMTLWLPLLDHARSYKPLLGRIAAHVPRTACIAAPQVPRALLAALESMGGYRVDAVTPAELSPCEFLLAPQTPTAPPPPFAGWELVARVARPTDRFDLTAIYRRSPAER
jgi:4-amino-4-deoxy-L-arabinose transferase-like glycosyltransferase